MSPLELAAALLTAACVVLTARQSVWCWPVGIVGLVLYTVIFWQSKLYSDAGLQGYYFVTSVYGWWHWRRGGPAGRPDAVPVTRLGWRGFAPWALLGVAAGLGWGYLMATYTDAQSPYRDAQIVGLSLVAQWLMARKVLECWFLWVAANTIAVPVYAEAGLYPTAVLYGVLWGLAWAGYIAWRRDPAGRRAG